MTEDSDLFVNRQSYQEQVDILVRGEPVDQEPPRRIIDLDRLQLLVLIYRQAFEAVPPGEQTKALRKIIDIPGIKELKPSSDGRKIVEDLLTRLQKEEDRIKGRDDRFNPVLSHFTRMDPLLKSGVLGTRFLIFTCAQPLMDLLAAIDVFALEVQEPKDQYVYFESLKNQFKAIGHKQGVFKFSFLLEDRLALLEFLKRVLNLLEGGMVKSPSDTLIRMDRPYQHGLINSIKPLISQFRI